MMKQKSVGVKELWGEGKGRGNNEEDLNGEEIDVVGVGNDVEKNGDEGSDCYRKVEKSRQNMKRKRNFSRDDDKEDENGKEDKCMMKEQMGKNKKMKKKVRFEEEYKGDDEKEDEESKNDKNANTISLRSRKILKINGNVEGKRVNEKNQRIEKSNEVKQFQSENINFGSEEKEKKKQKWRVEKKMNEVEGRGRLTRSKIRRYEEIKLKNKLAISGSKKETLVDMERTGVGEKIKEMMVGDKEIISLRKKKGVTGMYGERSDGEKIDGHIQYTNMDEISLQRKEGNNVSEESLKLDVKRKRIVRKNTTNRNNEGNKGEVQNDKEVMKHTEIGGGDEENEVIGKEKEYGEQKSYVAGEDVAKGKKGKEVENGLEVENMTVKMKMDTGKFRVKEIRMKKRKEKLFECKECGAISQSIVERNKHLIRQPRYF